MSCLPHIILSGAERFGDREALADPNHCVTYRELADRVLRLANGLVEKGLEPGDRCVLLLPNSVDFVVSHFAVLMAGGVSVPCEAGIMPSSLQDIARHAGARFLVAERGQYERIAPLVPTLPFEEIVVDGRELSEGQPAKVPASLPRNPSVLACLLYTTGTTGLPKGVMLSHANTLAALDNIQSFIGYTPEDREVVILPLSHSFGLGHVYSNLRAGGAVYTEHGLTRVGRVLKALESFRATGFPGTPMGFGMLLDRYAPILAEKGKNLRFTVINSAPLPPERTKQLRELLPNLDIMVYYGLTEASRSTFASLTRMGPAYYRSVGRPVGSVRLRIVDEQSREVPSGVEGEVTLGGPTVTRGYWNSPEETRAVLRDGWLHTGDLARLDEAGNLFITGRKKDVINVGGLKVNPVEVDEVLRKVPGVLDAAVAGIRGLPWVTGEAVVAAFVADEKAPPDPEALERHCRERLENYKVPVRYLPLPALPRTDTGKLKRSELVRLLEERLSEGSP